MDPENLTADELSLLDQISPNTTLDDLGAGRTAPLGTGADDEDDIVFGGEEEETETPAGFVPKAEFDRISGQVEMLTNLVKGRDAANVPVPAAPPVQTYAPQAPAAPPLLTEEQKAGVIARFFEDPIGMTNLIAQNAVAADRKQNESRHVETQAAIGRTVVDRLRDEALRDYPEYKAALPAMDKLMADTPPETIAALVQSGKLRDVYYDNFKSKAFDVAHKVTRAAVGRRRVTTEEEPPQLGARGVGNVTSIDKVRSGSKTIRMSDLNEVDREVVAQWRKMGWTPEDIARGLKESG